MSTLGLNANSNDKEDVVKASKLFRTIRKNGFIVEISSDIEHIQRLFLDQKIKMGVIYSGDALSIIEKDKSGNLTYVIPKEGSEIYFDSFMVLKDSPQKKLAYNFINYVYQPNVHATISTYLQYACPNMQAIKIIEKNAPDDLKNPAIYPSNRVLRKMRFINTNVGISDSMWQRIINE